MTKALIFDFDGTIVDTETPALDSAIDVWREHGAELDVDWWLTTIGSHRKRSWVSVLADEIGVALDEGEDVRGSDSVIRGDVDRVELEHLLLAARGSEGIRSSIRPRRRRSSRASS